MLSEFYATVAQVSFALLGLWWIVIQFRHEDWVHDRRRRRMGYDISMFFLLPGIMSLASLLAERLTYLWQVGFAAAGVIGVVVMLGVLRTVPGPSRSPSIGRAIHLVSLVLYVLVVVLAIRPELPSDLGIDLSGREVEAMLLSLLIFLGVNLAWLMFFEEPSPSPPGDDGHRSSPGGSTR